MVDEVTKGTAAEVETAVDDVVVVVDDNEEQLENDVDDEMSLGMPERETADETLAQPDDETPAETADETPDEAADETLEATWENEAEAGGRGATAETVGSPLEERAAAKMSRPSVVSGRESLRS